MLKLGLIINPMAGVGGSAALKGSDGPHIVAQALDRGAVPKASSRARQTLEAFMALSPQVMDQCKILTCAGPMGFDALRGLGFDADVVYSCTDDQSTAQDTIAAANSLRAAGVDLLLFVGGDGTARNIYDALSTNGATEQLPVLGVPAGVKIHSGVYAVSPDAAAHVLAEVAQGNAMSVFMGEVRDIDEELFRQGRVQSRVYGELAMPVSTRYIQQVKCGGRECEELAVNEIAQYVQDEMQADTLYVMGSGSTVGAVMAFMDFEYSLLGVDVVSNSAVAASDVTEQQLWELVSNTNFPAKLFITVIGGQGHIFGRGNQQLSARVIRAIGLDNIVILATQSKLDTLDQRPMIVDTGDSKLNQSLCGLKPVLTGYDDFCFYRVALDYGEEVGEE